MAFISLQMKHYCTCFWQNDMICGGVQDLLLKALRAKLRNLHSIISEDSRIYESLVLLCTTMDCTYCNKMNGFNSCTNEIVKFK